MLNRFEGIFIIADSEPKTFRNEFKETFGDHVIKTLLVIAAISSLQKLCVCFV